MSSICRAGSIDSIDSRVRSAVVLMPRSLRESGSKLDRSVGQLHAREDTRAGRERVSRPDLDPLAEHDAAVDLAVVADLHVPADDRGADRRPGSDADPAEQHRTLHAGALADRHALA